MPLPAMNRAKQLPDARRFYDRREVPGVVGANAPLRAVVMSRSARPVATTYRQTQLASERSLIVPSPLDPAKHTK